MAQEKVVTTRFIDGVPEGIRVSTSPLSPITTVYMPRNLLSRAKQLGLPKRGIYYLLKNGSTGIKKAYVGQTVKGIQRLNDHNSKVGRGRDVPLQRRAHLHTRCRDWP